MWFLHCTARCIATRVSRQLAARVARAQGRNFPTLADPPCARGHQHARSLASRVCVGSRRRRLSRTAIPQNCESQAVPRRQEGEKPPGRPPHKEPPPHPLRPARRRGRARGGGAAGTRSQRLGRLGPCLGRGAGCWPSRGTCSPQVAQRER